MKRILLVAALVLATSAAAQPTGGTAVAIVTAEQQNELIAVELSSGKVLRRVTLPADPENVAALAGRARTVVVASPRAGAVTLLDEHTLKVRRILTGFAAPHIVAISPFGKWAYVTDDARGELVVIALGTRRVVARLFVGLGAHHMAIGPSGRRMWIALGERAAEIAIVDLSKPAGPRLVRRFPLGFVAHDLTFSPFGARVWVTSAAGDTVHVLHARTAEQVFAVRVGPGPQHVAFAEMEASAFVTSGYSSRIVKVDGRTGRIVAQARTPYGSFNLSTLAGVLVTTSLMNGRTTEFDAKLNRIRTMRTASATRAVALTVWP
jgi:DNA-binding beta-propeller fold protein YncE